MKIHLCVVLSEPLLDVKKFVAYLSAEMCHRGGYWGKKWDISDRLVKALVVTQGRCQLNFLAS